MSQKILSSLYAQKSSINRELYDVVATVSPKDHADALHTMVRTLNHIYVVDQIFRAHLQGERHAYIATNTPETPELDALHFAVTETDHWFESYLAEVTGDALGESLSFQFTDGDMGKMTREEMLFHVLTHGAYHRGNVGQVLKGISVAPPRDLFTRFLHLREPARRLA